MVKYRLSRYTETFEQFYGLTTEVAKRINEQRTEVAAMLTRLSIWVNKESSYDEKSPTNKTRPNFETAFQQAKDELEKWNNYIELYLKKPDYKFEFEPSVSSYLSIEPSDFKQEIKETRKFR